jgi:hypothetical protein
MTAEFPKVDMIDALPEGMEVPVEAAPQAVEGGIIDSVPGFPQSAPEAADTRANVARAGEPVVTHRPGDAGYDEMLGRQEANSALMRAAADAEAQRFASYNNDGENTQQ